MDLLVCQREGLSCFSSLIDSGGSPSIKSERLSTSVNPALQLFRKTGGSLAPESLTAQRLRHMNSERHVDGFEHVQTTSRSRDYIWSHSGTQTLKQKPVHRKSKMAFKLSTEAFFLNGLLKDKLDQFDKLYSSWLKRIYRSSLSVCNPC